MNLRRFGARAHFALLLLIGLASPVQAQVAADAEALLLQSIAAHAEGPARLRLAYRGTSVSADQVAHPDGPARAHPFAVDIALDETVGAIAFHSESGIDGDFRFPRQVGFADGSGFATRYTGDYDRLGAFPADANAFVPHRLLTTILESATAGALTAGPDFDRIAYRLPSGASATLLIDRVTHLLAAVQRPPLPSPFGDRQATTIYGPYRRVGAVMVPETIVVNIDYPALERGGFALSLVEASDEGPNAAELATPTGSVEHRADSSDLQTIAFGADAWLLRNAAVDGLFSYNVLLVRFADHLLVVEAALNDATSQRVIETAQHLAPGLPIRTLVQTHHHGDHIGGIRTYIAAGAHILAPQGTSGFIERMAGAHSAIASDVLAGRPVTLQVEEVAGDRRISDSRNELQLFDLPTEHSDHMLIAYLPRQRLLFQADLVSAGELPLNQSGRDFFRWLSARRLAVETLAGVHGAIVSGAELGEMVRSSQAAGAGQ